MVWEWKGIVGPIIIRSHIVLHWKFIQLKLLPMFLHKVHLNLEIWLIDISIVDVTSSYPITLDFPSSHLNFLIDRWSSLNLLFFCLWELVQPLFDHKTSWFIVLIVHQWLQVVWIDVILSLNINHLDHLVCDWLQSLWIDSCHLNSNWTDLYNSLVQSVSWSKISSDELKNLIELDFQLESGTWKLFKIFNLDGNIFEIWDF